jgi:FkbH-like protein
MAADHYLDLGWLPRPPDDFNDRLRALSLSEVDLGAKLRRLAAFGLDEVKLYRLARVVKQAVSAKNSLTSLDPLKLAIISNATVDFLEPAILATGIRHGFLFQIFSTRFGQVIQDTLDPDSEFNKFAPDVVLCAVDYRGLPIQLCPGDEVAARATVDAAIDYFASIRRGIEQNGKAVCIFQTLARPAEPLFGSLDVVLAGTWRDLTSRINRGLADSLAGSPHLLLDTAGIAETVGLGRWHDPVLWNLARAPFANVAVPLFADHLARLISAWRGKTRRCLVLDLDNTVWGGVIGDDGVDQIVIGEGNPVGEAHLEIQRTVLRLRERGIVLAVSSKNDDDTARAPFREHADMLLREDHLAVFQANWRDKATNIKAISEELALGLESIAFLDDNPVERGLVREILPSVAVPELLDDPALFSRSLMASGCFEAILFSPEDRKRADDYQSNARRLALQKSAGNVDEYLRSLEMEITYRPFDSQGRARISQLINKSNQFNLTTRRYSEVDVAALERDRDVFTMQVRLKDRFADNGMISVIICRRDLDSWTIDTWLMSCRVLGRQVEKAVLQALGHHARVRKVKRLVGTYKPTSRNSMVARHYPDLGFAPHNVEQEGVSSWTIAVEDISQDDVWMRVHDFIPEVVV